MHKFKGERSFQGREIHEKNKIQLNTDGRDLIGSHDCRYKTSITGFSEIQKCMYVGGIKGFRIAKKTVINCAKQRIIRRALVREILPCACLHALAL
jgi:hypothetical protein